VYKTQNIDIYTVPHTPKLNVELNMLEPSPKQAATPQQQQCGEVAPCMGQFLPPLRGAKGCRQAHPAHGEANANAVCTNPCLPSAKGEDN